MSADSKSHVEMFHAKRPQIGGFYWVYDCGDGKDFATVLGKLLGCLAGPRAGEVPPVRSGRVQQPR